MKQNIMSNNPKMTIFPNLLKISRSAWITNTFITRTMKFCICPSLFHQNRSRHLGGVVEMPEWLQTLTEDYIYRSSVSVRNHSGISTTPPRRLDRFQWNKNWQMQNFMGHVITVFVFQADPDILSKFEKTVILGMFDMTPCFIFQEWINLSGN